MREIAGFCQSLPLASLFASRSPSRLCGCARHTRKRQRHPPKQPSLCSAPSWNNHSSDSQYDQSVPITSSSISTSSSVSKSKPNQDVPQLHLNALRCHKLALLLIDLDSRISVEITPPLPSSISSLLTELSTVATILHPSPLHVSPQHQHHSDLHHIQIDNIDTSSQSDEGIYESSDASIRATVRTLLWKLKNVLQPLAPSSSLRVAVEVARSACLHTQLPSDSAASLSSYAYAVQLSADIVLLQELQELRRCERKLHHAVVHNHGRNWPGLRSTASAVTQLGLDDYRVRGKSRLVNAISSLVAHISHSYLIHPEVSLAVEQLQSVLEASSENDRVARRPAGRAMLLRPRISDIPNFDRVTDILLRGGQPSQAGLQWLFDYGVTVIVDLRGSDRRNQWHSNSGRLVNIIDDSSAYINEVSFQENSNGNDSHTEDNEICQVINADGERCLNICNIPIEDFGTPTFEQLEQFMAIVSLVHNQNGVVFVHCKAGIGRTGTLIACWRIFNGMAADQALAKETLYSDFGGGLKQETFIRQYEDYHLTKSIK